MQNLNFTKILIERQLREGERERDHDDCLKRVIAIIYYGIVALFALLHNAPTDDVFQSNLI